MVDRADLIGMRMPIRLRLIWKAFIRFFPLHPKKQGMKLQHVFFLLKERDGK